MKPYKSLSANVFLLIFWLFLPVVLYAEAGDQEAVTFRVQAERWHEAGAIFHADPRWLGGDGAATVDLGEGRVLWLFGDSFVDLSGRGNRSSAALVRNCIAIQTGYDPTRAEMQFFWKTDESEPAAFFRNKGDTWLWPASGIVAGRHLLVFLMKIQSADNDLGFAPMGWKAAWVDNIQARPDRWHLTWLVSPQRQGMVVGIGTPIFQDGYLLVFAAKGGGDEVYLVRWPVAAVKKGMLTAPEWWAGQENGWIDLQSGDMPPAPVFTERQMEFSVAYHDGIKRYMRVQTKRFLNPCLSVATAPVLTGPWTEPACFYTPPAQGDPDLLIYAGKHHPMLSGADMVVSYVVNTLHADRLLSDMQLYYPVLLKGRIVGDYSVNKTWSSGPGQR
ncbi:MAG: DUF4185 domain-containing protein [Thermodesulfobacteriota bacterium]|nr:DUF4185 domain-containing protein [Thermodesulfobacteriota bacterium]